MGIVLTILTSLAGSTDVFSPDSIAKYISYLADLVMDTDANQKGLEALRDNIRQHVAAGTDPTSADLAALKARSDVLHDGIQSARPNG